MSAPSLHRLVAVALLTGAALSAQSSQNMSLVAHVPYAPCTTGDVWAMGDHMLVARRSQGFSVIDVRDPANPVSTTIHPPGFPASSSSYGVGDIKGDGRYIYATNESSGGGVFIYDTMPNPMSPTRALHLTHWRIDGGVHNCWIEGSHLYCVSNNTSLIEVYDISNLSSPQHVASLGQGISSVWAHDVTVFDDRAYCALLRGGLAIYDVSNPASPVLLGSVNYNNSFTHNAWPSEDRRYVYTTDENDPGGVGGSVRIWDVQNPAAITQVGGFKTGATSSIVHNAVVHGEMLFVSYYKEGVRVTSLRNDPTNPVEIAHYDTFAPTGGGCFWSSKYAGNWGVHPFDRDHVFVSDMDSGAYIFSLEPVPNTFTANATTVSGGSTLNLTLSYQNATPTELAGLGAIVLTGINGNDFFSLLALDVPVLTSGQAGQTTYSLTVPPGLPSGLTAEFTGITGTSDPLTTGDQKSITITMQ